MKNSGDMWSLNLRRFSGNVVDVLVGATAFVMAYATIDGAADSLELLIGGAIALVGIGLLLEPTVVAQPGRDIDARPLGTSTQSNVGDGRSGDDFCATMGEATSP